MGVGEQVGKSSALVRRAAALLASDHSFDELFARLTEMLAELVDASTVFVALPSGSAGYAVEYLFDHGKVLRGNVPLRAGSVALRAIREERLIWGNAPDQWAPDGRIAIDSEHPERNDSISAIFAPMRHAGAIVGCLSVQSPKPDAYTEAEAELVAAIAHFLGVALENRRLFDQSQRIAQIDPLTGLPNHSKLVRDLEVLVGRATSTRPVAAAIFNVVNFSQFNDTYGYALGDEMLHRIAATISAFAAPNVTVGRYGGDAFLMIVHGESSERAIATIDELARAFSELTFENSEGRIPISLACGYALAPIDALTRVDLIALCTHRRRLSRKRGGAPVGDDEIDALALNGNFAEVQTLVDALMDRDPFTRVHLVHVNAMAKHWSEANLDLQASEFSTFMQASLLHDLGKLLVSDRILVKPGRLTAAEYRSMQEHARFGHNILSDFHRFDDVARVVAQHHERWDGNGYPNGIAGEDIDRLARAVAILDAFSAMVDDRPYHRGITEAEAILEIRRCAGTQFDPELVERFVTWRAEGGGPGAV